MKAVGTNVIPEWVPCLTDVVRFGLGQILERRIFFQELVVLGNDPIDLRLLKHHFRNKNSVRVHGPPPRQIASTFAIPFE